MEVGEQPKKTSKRHINNTFGPFNSHSSLSVRPFAARRNAAEHATVCGQIVDGTAIYDSCERNASDERKKLNNLKKFSLILSRKL